MSEIAMFQRSMQPRLLGLKLAGFGFQLDDTGPSRSFAGGRGQSWLSALESAPAIERSSPHRAHLPDGLDLDFVILVCAVSRGGGCSRISREVSSLGIPRSITHIRFAFP